MAKTSGKLTPLTIKADSVGKHADGLGLRSRGGPGVWAAFARRGYLRRRPDQQLRTGRRSSRSSSWS